MRRRVVLMAVLAGCLLGLTSAGGAGAAPRFAMTDPQHGIGLTEGCTSPTKVGHLYSCTWAIRNVLDDAGDTLTISMLSDTVTTGGGTVTNSSILDDAPVTPTAGASCTPPPNRVCTLPAGGQVQVGPFSFYTVQPLDSTLPGFQGPPADPPGTHRLTDDAILTWADTCDHSPQPSNCNSSPPPVGASSSSTVLGRTSQTATTIHKANEGPVTVTSGQEQTPCPAGSFNSTFDPSTGNVSVTYDQFPAPNDNSYGANAVGWGANGHKFTDLLGSDYAGFSVMNPSGTSVLDFHVDYISLKSGTPSGYGSLGPFGGNGSINVGTLSPGDLTYDTSFSRDLNNLGYFSGGVQIAGTYVVNLLVNSPPTSDPSGTTPNAYVLTPGAAAVFTGSNTDSRESPGWNFHDTYFVTLNASKLIAIGAVTQNGPSSFSLNPGWSFAPTADEPRSAPAKPCA